MSIYEHTDAAVANVMATTWEQTAILAANAQVTQADALYHMQRALKDAIGKMRFSDTVDFAPDGRAAVWRVRLQLWAHHIAADGSQHTSLVADTDPGPEYRERLIKPGSTLIPGLKNVGRWVQELTQLAHPDCDIEGMGDGDVASKIKTLRVTLTKSSQDCVWRLHYLARPQVPTELPVLGQRSLKGVGAMNQATAGIQRTALLRIQREDKAQGTRARA